MTRRKDAAIEHSLGYGGPGVASKRPARQKEGALSDAIRERLELEYRGRLLLYRNSQAVMRKGSRVYRGGLGNGSADLVGALTVRVSSDGWEPDVLVPPDQRAACYRVGRAIALEVKRPGEIPSEAEVQAVVAKGDYGRSKDDARTLAQWQWLAAFRAVGGFACYVDSPESAVAAIERALRGESS